MHHLSPSHCPFWSEPLLPLLLGLGLLVAPALEAATGVSNLRASQRAGTTAVDIRYDLTTTTTNPMLMVVAVSTNGGVSYDLPATNFSGDVGLGVTAGTNKWIVWEAIRDWPARFSTNVFFRLTASDAPPGMALIPAGPFTMGDTLDGDFSALPLHTNQVR